MTVSEFPSIRHRQIPAYVYVYSGIPPSVPQNVLNKNRIQFEYLISNILSERPDRPKKSNRVRHPKKRIHRKGYATNSTANDMDITSSSTRSLSPLPRTNLITHSGKRSPTKYSWKRSDNTSLPASNETTSSDNSKNPLGELHILLITICIPVVVAIIAIIVSIVGIASFMRHRKRKIAKINLEMHRKGNEPLHMHSVGVQSSSPRVYNKFAQCDVYNKFAQCDVSLLDGGKVVFARSVRNICKECEEPLFPDPDLFCKEFRPSPSSPNNTATQHESLLKSSTSDVDDSPFWPSLRTNEHHTEAPAYPHSDVRSISPVISVNGRTTDFYTSEGRTSTGSSIAMAVDINSSTTNRTPSPSSASSGQSSQSSRTSKVSINIKVPLGSLPLDWFAKDKDIGYENVLETYSTSVNTQTDDWQHSNLRPRPIFCPSWQAFQTFSHAGGIMRLPRSDVKVMVPSGAVRDETYVDVCGGSYTNLLHLRKVLKLDDNEVMVSPLAELNTGVADYRFQKNVELFLPHILPPGVDKNHVKVYHVDIDPSGNIKTQVLTSADAEQDDLGFYRFLPDNQLVVYTRRCCGYICSICQKRCPEPAIFLAATDRQAWTRKPSDRMLRQIKVRLILWDRKITIKDFQRDYVDCRIVEEQILHVVDNFEESDVKVIFSLLQDELDEASGGEQEEKWKLALRPGTNVPIFPAEKEFPLKELLHCYAKDAPRCEEWLAERISRTDEEVGQVFQCIIDVFNIARDCPSPFDQSPTSSLPRPPQRQPKKATIFISDAFLNCGDSNSYTNDESAWGSQASKYDGQDQTNNGQWSDLAKRTAQSNVFQWPPRPLRTPVPQSQQSSNAHDTFQQQFMQDWLPVSVLSHHHEVFNSGRHPAAPQYNISPGLAVTPVPKIPQQNSSSSRARDLYQPPQPRPDSSQGHHPHNGPPTQQVSRALQKYGISPHGQDFRQRVLPLQDIYVHREGISSSPDLRPANFQPHNTVVHDYRRRPCEQDWEFSSHSSESHRSDRDINRSGEAQMRSPGHRNGHDRVANYPLARNMNPDVDQHFIEHIAVKSWRAASEPILYSSSLSSESSGATNTRGAESTWKTDTGRVVTCPDSMRRPRVGTGVQHPN